MHSLTCFSSCQAIALLQKLRCVDGTGSSRPLSTHAKLKQLKMCPDRLPYHCLPRALGLFVFLASFARVLGNISTSKSGNWQVCNGRMADLLVG